MVSPARPEDFNQHLSIQTSRAADCLNRCAELEEQKKALQSRCEELEAELLFLRANQMIQNFVIAENSDQFFQRLYDLVIKLSALIREEVSDGQPS